MNQAGQVNILILDKDEEIHKVFQPVGSQNGYTFDFVAEAYVALLRIVKGRLPDIFQIFFPKQVRAKLAPGRWTFKKTKGCFAPIY
jgi:hypothetical protein